MKLTAPADQCMWQIRDGNLISDIQEKQCCLFYLKWVQMKAHPATWPSSLMEAMKWGLRALMLMEAVDPNVSCFSSLPVSVPAVNAANNFAVSPPPPIFCCVPVCGCRCPHYSERFDYSTELNPKQVNPTGVGASAVCPLIVLTESPELKKISVSVQLCVHFHGFKFLFGRQWWVEKINWNRVQI